MHAASRVRYPDCFRAVLMALASLLATRVAQAAMAATTQPAPENVTFNFTGSVTFVEDVQGIFNESIAPGATFLGNYAFDPVTTNGVPGLPGETVYPDCMESFVMWVGHYEFAGTGQNNAITVQNGPLTDAYVVRNSSMTLLGESLDVTLTLIDLDGTAFSDGALPTWPPDIALFEVAELTITAGGIRGGGFFLSGVVSAIDDDPIPDPDPDPDPGCPVPVQCAHSERCVRLRRALASAGPGELCPPDACCREYCCKLIGGECECVCEEPVVCNDGNPCTLDGCDPGSGCQFPPACPDDSNHCNGDESCENGSCVHSGNPCDDGNVCNGTEGCDQQSGCSPDTPLVCNDNNVCNGVETCDPVAGCQPGTPLDCLDDLCCNGADGCDPQSGCTHTGNPCTPFGLVCDESLPEPCCRPCANDAECDDGNDCTEDRCEITGCTHTNLTGSECEEDTDPCTVETCQNGNCIFDHYEPDCEACGTSAVCLDGICTATSCSISLESGEVCPNGMVRLALGGECTPAHCGPLTVEITSSLPATVSAWPNTYFFSCLGKTIFADVYAEDDAVPGDSALLTALVTGPPGFSCAEATATVDVIGPDIDFDAVPDEFEYNPGVLLALNSNDDANGASNCIPDLEETGPDPDVKIISLSATGCDPTGEVWLKMSGGAGRIKLYEDAARTVVLYDATDPEHDETQIQWSANSFPDTLYVEGVLPSGMGPGTFLEFLYEGPGGCRVSTSCASGSSRLIWTWIRTTTGPSMTTTLRRVRTTRARMPITGPASSCS